ncbi:MAG: MFS transporter, partial [Thermoplasmata archaeon]|nr:MFS transporter [Thermoplasmata archaeon]
LLNGALDNFVELTALPNIVTDLRQPSGVTFVVSAYIISSTVAVPIFAKLSDLLSRRNVFLLGLVIFIAGSLLAGLSQNLNELIAFRGLQGFGSGGFFPVGIAITAVIFAPEMRARLTGAFSAVFGVATVGGPFLGSFIVDHTSWRWVFYINIPIGLVGMAILLTTLGPLRPERRGSFDAAGAAVLAGWVGALTFALFQVSQGGWTWSDPRILGLLAVSLALFVVFVVWELRTKEPIVPLRLFRNRVVLASGGNAFLRGVVMFSLTTFISVYVGLVLLNGAPNAADTVRDVLYALVIPLVLGSAIGGQLLVRIPYRPLVASGMALAAFGSFFLIFLTTSTPTWTFAYGFLPSGGLILPLMPIGFGMGLTFSATVISVQNQVPRQDVGAASGLVQFLQGLGGAMGIALLTSFQQVRFDALRPTSAPLGCVPGAPPSGVCLAYLQSVQGALVTSYDDVFVAMFGVLLLAVVFALFLTGRLPRKAPEVRKGPISEVAANASIGSQPSSAEPQPSSAAPRWDAEASGRR